MCLNRYEIPWKWNAKKCKRIKNVPLWLGTKIKKKKSPLWPDTRVALIIRLYHTNHLGLQMYTLYINIIRLFQKCVFPSYVDVSQCYDSHKSNNHILTKPLRTLVSHSQTCRFKMLLYVAIRDYIVCMCLNIGLYILCKDWLGTYRKWFLY